MPPRLGFKKSRSGCQSCKERRVKCDEKQPCSACKRHGVICSLQLLDNTVSQRSQVTKQGQQQVCDTDEMDSESISKKRRRFSSVAQAAHELFPRTSSDTAPNLSTQPIRTLVSHSAENWKVDLELMHHYSCFTYASLPRGTEVCDVWQTKVPQLASKHTFLMHQVLATSAYHMAFHNSSKIERRRYLLYASQHQNDALISLQDALSSINTDNCHAFFAASSLLSICSFAALSSDDTSYNSALAELVDVFCLIRGMNTILLSYRDDLEQGVLQDLFMMGEQDNVAPALSIVINQLQHYSVPVNTDLNTGVVCTNAISDTIGWIETTNWKTGSAELRFCLSWPIALKEEFLNLLREQNPIALAILAHYAALLHLAGTRFWFLEGWGRKVLADISNSMDPTYSYLLDWLATAISDSS